MISKIISGGQTGIDRVGLNVGISLGMEIGGWAPKHFRAEDGKVPEFYGLKEYSVPGYAARTEQNVLDSDATIIFKPMGCYSAGTSLTIKLCARHDVSCIIIDVCSGFEENVTKIAKWLKETKTRTLNVAGPRQSVLNEWSYKMNYAPKISYAHECFKVLKFSVTKL